MSNSHSIAAIRATSQWGVYNLELAKTAGIIPAILARYLSEVDGFLAGRWTRYRFSEIHAMAGVERDEVEYAIPYLSRIGDFEIKMMRNKMDSFYVKMNQASHDLPAPPLLSPEDGFVYLAEFPGSRGTVKIGATSNPMQRTVGLRSTYGRDTFISHTIITDSKFAAEKVVHQAFKDRRVRKSELFALTNEEVYVLKSMAGIFLYQDVSEATDRRPSVVYNKTLVGRVPSRVHSAIVGQVINE